MKDMPITQLLHRIVLRTGRIVSKIRGYQRSFIAGSEFRLAPESSCFDSVFDAAEELDGAGFVRWTDLVQMQMFIKRLEGLAAPVVVDVGAHHGLYALLAGVYCKKQKRGRVLAFEPVLDNFHILKKNTVLNDLEQWVTPIRKAVGEVCQKVQISLSGSQSKVSASNSINSEYVEQVDLSSELPGDIKHIDILIIDVEGAELPVLRGFPWERIDVSHIFCEFHPYAWKDFSYSAADITDFLNARGLQAIDMSQQDQTDCRSKYYVGPTLFRRVKED